MEKLNRYRTLVLNICVAEVVRLPTHSVGRPNSHEFGYESSFTALPERLVVVQRSKFGGLVVQRTLKSAATSAVERARL